MTDLYLGGNAEDISTLNGTVTRAWGWHAGALSKSTADFQFGATAQTVTGTVPSGEGAWGTETHTPSRFYFKNDSNQIWRLGTIKTRPDLPRGRRSWERPRPSDEAPDATGVQAGHPSCGVPEPSSGKCCPHPVYCPP